METLSLKLILFTLPFFITGFLCEKTVSADGQDLQNGIQDGGQLADQELMAALLIRVTQLEARDKQYQDTVQSLENTIDLQNRRISVLETVVEHVTSAGVKVEDLLKSDVYDHETETGEVHQKTRKGNGSLDRKRDTAIRHRRDTDGNRSRRQEISAVAFYASIDSHHLQNLGADQDVPFDKVYTNVGGAYHPVLGVFIAPQPGTYVFSTTIMDVNQHDTRYYFSVNGQAFGPLFIHGLSSYLGSISKTATLLLKKGDEVSIRNSNVGEGIYGFEYSSFSGFMLSFDDSPGIVVG